MKKIISYLCVFSLFFAITANEVDIVQENSTAIQTMIQKTIQKIKVLTTKTKKIIVENSENIAIYIGIPMAFFLHYHLFPNKELTSMTKEIESIKRTQDFIKKETDLLLEEMEEHNKTDNKIDNLKSDLLNYTNPPERTEQTNNLTCFTMTVDEIREAIKNDLIDKGFSWLNKSLNKVSNNEMVQRADKQFEALVKRTYDFENDHSNPLSDNQIIKTNLSEVEIEFFKTLIATHGKGTLKIISDFLKNHFALCDDVKDIAMADKNFENFVERTYDFNNPSDPFSDNQIVKTNLSKSELEFIKAFIEKHGKKGFDASYEFFHGSK